jgi:hypothetical protein
MGERERMNILNEQVFKIVWKTEWERCYKRMRIGFVEQNLGGKDEELFRDVCHWNGVKAELSRVLLAHVYDPSYSGGRDQENRSLKPPGADSLQGPILKKPITK